MGSCNSHPRRHAPLFLAGALASATMACPGNPLIQIDEQPEARLSPMLPGACAVFMKIANPGSAADALVDAQVDLPGAVTRIHAVQDGRMVPSGKLVVPAHGVLELKPGGVHIMVFELPSSSAAGDEFTLRLRFEKSGEKRTSVRIRG